jgi:hypothetical protein
MMTLKIGTREMVSVKFDKVRMLLAGLIRESDNDDGDDWSSSYVAEVLGDLKEALEEGIDSLSGDIVLQVPEGSDVVVVGP